MKGRKRERVTQIGIFQSSSESIARNRSPKGPKYKLVQHVDKSKEKEPSNQPQMKYIPRKLQNSCYLSVIDRRHLTTIIG